MFSAATDRGRRGQEHIRSGGLHRALKRFVGIAVAVWIAPTLAAPVVAPMADGFIK
jgi:hypothetical protein